MVSLALTYFGTIRFCAHSMRVVDMSWFYHELNGMLGQHTCIICFSGTGTPCIFLALTWHLWFPDIHFASSC